MAPAFRSPIGRALPLSQAHTCPPCVAGLAAEAEPVAFLRLSVYLPFFPYAVRNIIDNKSDTL